MTSLVYDSAEDSLLVHWEPTGPYQLNIIRCDDSAWLSSTVSTCTPVVLLGIRQFLGSSNVFVDVRSCDDQNECMFSPPSGAMVKHQSLAGLDLRGTGKYNLSVVTCDIIYYLFLRYVSKRYADCTISS